MADLVIDPLAHVRAGLGRRLKLSRVFAAAATASALKEAEDRIASLEAAAREADEEAARAVDALKRQCHAAERAAELEKSRAAAGAAPLAARIDALQGEVDMLRDKNATLRAATTASETSAEKAAEALRAALRDGAAERDSARAAHEALAEAEMCVAG